MKGTKLNRIGIDVSAKELVIKIEKKGNIQDGVCVFSNDKVGHKKLLKYITKNGANAQVCLEATGIYHFELALLLYYSKNVEIMVVNPKAIKHFSIALMKRSKTDPIDSSTILEYLRRMEFTPWEAPSETCINLQAINRRIHQLKVEITRELGRRHANEYRDSLSNTINNDIDVNIRHLKKRIAMLEDKALTIIKESEQLNKKFNLLTSIKGVAQTSAVQILAELICLPKDMRAEQWVAYAGLDPQAFQSGSSINKPKRISKTGNKYLRTALYMPAWVAVKHEPKVAAFYNKLIDAGKKPMQAIVAVMRKLLHAIWGILQSQSEWDASRFYQPQN